MRGVCSAALNYGVRHSTALGAEMPPHSPETREGAAAFSSSIRGCRVAYAAYSNDVQRRLAAHFLHTVTGFIVFPSADSTQRILRGLVMMQAATDILLL